MARTWSEFEDLAEAWSELAFASNASIFQTYDWIDVWRRHFGAQFSPNVVAVWRDSQMVALAPLGIRKQRLIPGLPMAGISSLQFLADMRTPSNALLVAPGHEDTFDVLFDALFGTPGNWSFMRLRNFAPAPEQQFLRRAISARDLSYYTRPVAESVVLKAPEGWDPYVKSQPRSFRKNLRKAQKRISETDHRILDQRTEPESILDKIILLSQRSWKGVAGQSIACQENGPEFLRALWQRFGPMGQMCLHLLEVEGETVASLVSLKRRTRGYAFLTEFNEKFASLSPGRFIVAHGIAQMCDDGVKEIDLLRKSAFSATFSDDIYRHSEFDIYRRRSLKYVFQLTRRAYPSILKRSDRKKRKTRSLKW